MKPLAIDLFCGLGGWTDGLLAEGYDVVWFDLERHVYGEHGYPAQLVLQDVLTLHGSQFRDAALIVASPPCQEYSYMAMPWTRAKAIEMALLDQGDFPDKYKGSRSMDALTALFNACFRIQREACAAAGHHIPLVVENVKGAQPWVGRSRWNYGSFHLWGDGVPALMPMARGAFKATEGTKNAALGGGSWFKIDHNKDSGHRKNPVEAMDGVKFHASGRAWFDLGPAAHSSKSNARKAASAMIAKIPLALSRHIARTWKPAP